VIRMSETLLKLFNPSMNNMNVNLYYGYYASCELNVSICLFNSMQIMSVVPMPIGLEVAENYLNAGVMNGNFLQEKSHLIPMHVQKHSSRETMYITLLPGAGN